MAKNYKEAPWWWYVAVLVISFFLGLAVVLKEDVTLPAWGYVVVSSKTQKKAFGSFRKKQRCIRVLLIVSSDVFVIELDTGHRGCSLLDRALCSLR